MLTIWYSRMTAVVMLMVTLMVTPAWSQNAIQSVTGSLQDGSEVIRIEMAEALSAVPAGFAVKAPPRIALDLPGVANATGRNSIEINLGRVICVALAQSLDRTRVVVNLKKAADYQVKINGKTLLLILDPAHS